MGLRNQKYISSFLVFAIGAICSALPVMAQQSDTCTVIFGSNAKTIAQYEEAQKRFPKPLYKKITKSFAKKLKQAKYNKEHASAAIAFRLPNDSSKGLELQVESYSEQFPKVERALVQAIQENIKADRDGIQSGVCYREAILYKKPHPWGKVILYMSLPIIVPVARLTVLVLTVMHKGAD